MPTTEKIIDTTMLGYYHQQVNPANADDLQELSDKVDEIISEGGEPNVIETVKVNGTALTPVNKAVDVEVPTKTSDLTNDGDGTSNFATEEYVDENGGKIDVIKVNGETQTITNKEVDIEVPKFYTSKRTNEGKDVVFATVNNTKYSYLNVLAITENPEVVDIYLQHAAGVEVDTSVYTTTKADELLAEKTDETQVQGMIDDALKATYTIATASDIDAILNA